MAEKTPVRIIRRDGSIAPDIVGEIDNLRRALVVPVTWRRHYFWKCASWTFDARTFRHFETAIELVNFVVDAPDGRRLIYALPVREFLSARHNSVECYDSRRRFDEKYHVPAGRFRGIIESGGKATVVGTVDDQIEREFGRPANAPESVTAKQGALW